MISLILYITTVICGEPGENVVEIWRKLVEIEEVEAEVWRKKWKRVVK